jgi:hypothetical protein
MGAAFFRFWLFLISEPLEIQCITTVHRNGESLFIPLSWAIGEFFRKLFQP